MTSYQEWKIIYRDVKKDHEVYCCHFGVSNGVNYNECKTCCIRSECLQLVRIFNIVCDKYDSTKCDTDCRDKNPDLNHACMMESSVEDPVPIVEIDMDLTRKRKGRRMFQFGDKK